MFLVQYKLEQFLFLLQRHFKIGPLWRRGIICRLQLVLSKAGTQWTYCFPPERR